MRTVHVKALADPSLVRSDAHWEQTVKDLVQAASDHFEREFRIRFLVGAVMAWPLKEKTSSTSRLLTRLKEDAPLESRDDHHDLVIGFTGQNVNVYTGGTARVDRIGSCGEGLGNYIVTSVRAPFRYTHVDAEPEWDVLALIHEFGHIFGAPHVDDQSSIMHHDFAYRTEFDPRSRHTILRNRLCGFHASGAP